MTLKKCLDVNVSHVKNNLKMMLREINSNQTKKDQSTISDVQYFLEARLMTDCRSQ